MLLMAKSLKELRFRELMDVYADSVAREASQCRDLPQGLAIQLAEQDMYQYLKDVFFRISGAICAVWQEEGLYVSALRLEPYRDGLLLAALETAPAARKKGYASILVREVQDWLRQQGDLKLYSHVGKHNTASLKTHFACGFVKISDYAVYLDGSVDHRCCTMLYEIK